MRLEAHAIFHGQNKLKVRQESRAAVDDLEMLMPGTRYNSHDVFSVESIQHVPDAVNHQRLAGKQVGIDAVPFIAQSVKFIRSRFCRQLQHASPSAERDFL